VPAEQGKSRLSGKASPGQTVTIFIYSYLPVVLTTTADADGNWQYDLDSALADGEHEVYVTVTDDTGKIQGKSNPLSFFVAEAVAVTEQEFFKLPPPTAAEVAAAPADRMLLWYAIGAGALVLAALIVGFLIFFRRCVAGAISPKANSAFYESPAAPTGLFPVKERSAEWRKSPSRPQAQSAGEKLGNPRVFC